MEEPVILQAQIQMVRREANPEEDSAVNDVRSYRICYYLSIVGELVTRFQMPYL
jgi:hypothetical protein